MENTIKKDKTTILANLFRYDKQKTKQFTNLAMSSFM